MRLITVKKILIVGGGSIGERHLRCFQQVLDGEGEVALCDTREEIRAELAERYNLEQTFADLDEAARQKWDAAVVCTPAHLHIQHGLKLAESATSLMIEKPLSTALEGIEELKAAWQGRVLNVAYVLRVHPLLAKAREVALSGRIGEVLQMVVTSGQHFPTFRPAYREIYYTRHETGGGAIQDAATHHFNMVQYLLGDFDWVFCDAGHQALEGVTVEDTVHITGRTGGEKTMLSLSLNQFMAPNETTIQLNGSEGSLKVIMHELKLGVMRHGEEAWSWEPPLNLERDDLFREQARAFLLAASGQADVRCTLDEAEQTLRVNLAALKSAASGQRVAIN